MSPKQFSFHQLCTERTIPSVQQQFFQEILCTAKICLLGRYTHIRQPVSFLVHLVSGNLYDISLPFTHSLHHQFVHIRLNIIITVHKSQIHSRRHPNAKISRRGRPSIRLMVSPDTAIPQRQALTQFTRSICRSIVNQKNLQIPIRLRTDRPHTSLQTVYRIIYRYNDAYFLIHICQLISFYRKTGATLNGPSLAGTISPCISPSVNLISSAAACSAFHTSLIVS